jgi:nucleotide-binding universal stress UspA family protein
VPRILIAYDDSPSARAAVERAAALFPGAECRIAAVAAGLDDFEHAAAAASVGLTREEIQVAVKQLRASAVARATEIAEAGERLAGEAGLDVRSQMLETSGHEWDRLAEAARDEQADAIVCGTSRRGAMARAILGSVSSSLVRHASLPVLVVPAEAASDAGPLLIGFDASEEAERAIAAAGRLFAGDEALVVTAWRSQQRHSLTGRALAHAPHDIRELAQALDATDEQAARHDAERGAALAREHGLDARPLAIESPEPVSHVLLSTAGEQQARAIVVGRRGRNAAVSAILGSVSASLLHAAERPVLVV